MKWKIYREGPRSLPIETTDRTESIRILPGASRWVSPSPNNEMHPWFWLWYLFVVLAVSRSGVIYTGAGQDYHEGRHRKI